MKRIITFILLISMSITFCTCQKDDIEETYKSEEYNHYEVDIYVSDSEKEEWYNAIVKLISNQEEPYGTPADGIIGYEAPRPDEPSIASGFDMGLFDVTGDGTPELLLNMGGGSAGNDFFYIYDIFTGKIVGQVDGGGKKAWAIYYDTENSKYLPIGRYDWRNGDSGSIHFITTIVFDDEDCTYREKGLFYSSLEYDKIQLEDEEGKFAGIELEIDEVVFRVDGEPCGFQDYHYELTDFYQEHSLVPHTGLMLYYWSDVADEDDSYQKRAEKMAQMLLYGSGQKFVKTNK